MPATSNEVQFKRVTLDSLEGHPANYNQHPPAQIADLKASLMRYKQVRPIVVQQAVGEEQYIILAGHGITEAAKELYAENPAKYAHLNSWAVVIAPPEWSILDAKGYMVSDNHLGNKAEPDELSLAQLLEEQEQAGFDLASLGTDGEALRQMLEKLGDAYLDEEDDGRESPDDFKSYDEGIDTEYCCPKCSYQWSGKPK
ncbi:MAG TPA: ParB N-terminal domain-containing protein [Ktedonobacteraceae bacterium]|nr:ParB N-terminal domain-containing protein [Ktedonobacteraceae bacterium]